MRISEVEPKKQLSEAPLGAWSSMGNRLLSRMSGIAPTAAARAGGKVETGHIANVLHAQFQKFVGATGIKPTAKDVIDFLKRKGFPIEGASEILRQVDPTISAGTPSAPTAQPTTSQSVPPKTQSTQTRQKTKPKSPEDIRKAKQAAATKNVQSQMAPFSPMPDQNQAAGQQAFSNMAGGLEKMGNRPAVTTSEPGTKGGLGPKGRETLARLGKQRQDRESGNQGTLDLNEALPGDLTQGIIDKALLKAAQEFVLKGGQQGQNTSNISVNDTEPEGNYQSSPEPTTPTDVSTKLTLKQVVALLPKLNSKQLASLKARVDKAVASKQQSISVGGQKIDPSDPLYAKMKQQMAGK